MQLQFWNLNVAYSFSFRHGGRNSLQEAEIDFPEWVSVGH